MAKRDFYIRESELDDFQVRVIERRIDNSFIVKGCAGSGKSILALWKVKQIQERNLGTYQLIVFTKTLRRYMIDGIRSIGLNADNVTYYQKWKETKRRVDYIIVDEAQDFSEQQINEFKQYAKKALILYGDSAQQMYKFRKPQPISIEDIQYVTRFPGVELFFNHRLPKIIAEFAQHLNSSGDDLASRCQNEGSKKPKVVYFPSLKKQFEKIIELIQNGNMDDVGILFRTNAEVEYAANYFETHGMEVERKVNFEMDINFDSEKPKLLTYHSSKGTQFQNVFIPNCCTKEEDDKSVLYVALTRTYEGLFIFYTNELSPFIKDIPSSLYETSLTQNIKFDF